MAFRAAFYKGTHPGWPGVYNRGVRWMEKGPYSHVEIQFSDGISASASFMDGGVRFKQIDFSSGNWDFIDLPSHLEEAARQWYKDREGWAYDLWGNVHFVFGWVAPSPKKAICSGSVASSLGMETGWRYEPNVLYSALNLIAQIT